MQKKTIDELIQESQAFASIHSSHSMGLIEKDHLADALDYCKNQGIDPPQCSLTAKSANADRLRSVAKGMLSDEDWWKKRLKTKALRDFEHGKTISGAVTNIISDEMLAHMKKS